METGTADRSRCWNKTLHRRVAAFDVCGRAGNAVGCPARDVGHGIGNRHNCVGIGRIGGLVALLVDTRCWTRRHLGAEARAGCKRVCGIAGHSTGCKRCRCIVGTSPARDLTYWLGYSTRRGTLHACYDTNRFAASTTASGNSSCNARDPGAISDSTPWSLTSASISARDLVGVESPIRTLTRAAGEGANNR